jgi:hypothetical protein
VISPIGGLPQIRLCLLSVLLSLLSACGGGGGGLPGGVPPVTITITPVTSVITAGLTQQLSATLTNPDSNVVDVTKTARWTSQSPSIATVDATTGLVTAVTPGSAKITATLNAASGSTTVSISPPTHGWALTNTMATYQGDGLTSTLLPNGNVLVAGGSGGNGGVLADAEIFSPVTNTWTVTGSMTTPRQNHTATLLLDGTVLVAGGHDPNGQALVGAEIYDPAAGTWTATGSMSTSSLIAYSDSAARLPDGTVLFVGLSNNGTSTSQSAVIYDPTARTWTAVSDPMTWGIAALTSLADGSVLAVGSVGAYAATPLAAIYTPSSKMWTMTAAPGYALVFTATLLEGGNVLVAGGFAQCGEILCAVKVATLYNPSTRTWTSTGSVITVQTTATLLLDSTVLAAGGGAAGAEIYDPSTGVWTATENMTTARAHPAATRLLDGTVLLVGGASGFNDKGMITNSAEIYYP